MLKTIFLIFLAEMADKTQFMIMALCSKYTTITVALGMSLGAIMISFLSTSVGHLLTHIIPISYLQIGGACLFLLFGFFSLWSNKTEEEKHINKNHFPILSIAFAFIIAELGDKTQLSTIALATHENSTLVFIGSSIGLISSNILAIITGKLLMKNFNQTYLTLASSILFIYFGVTSLMNLKFISKSVQLIFILIIILIYWISSLHFLKQTQKIL